MAEQSASSHGIAKAVDVLLTQGVEKFGGDRMVLDLVEALR